jgi:hypothetical protein
MKEEKIDLMIAMVLRTRDDLDLIAREMIRRDNVDFSERALKTAIDCRFIINNIINEIFA